jgi:hypothetical protein
MFVKVEQNVIMNYEISGLCTVVVTFGRFNELRFLI